MSIASAMREMMDGVRPLAPCAPKRSVTEDDIRRECEAKGVPVEEHPGPAYYLCACGNFHISPGYEQFRSPLGWTTRKTLGRD